MSSGWSPIVSGLFGGLITLALAWLLRGQVTRRVGDRPIADVIEEYRPHLRFCGAFFIGCLVFAIVVFKRGWVASNDWRVLCVAFGLGGVAPVAAMYLWLPRVRFAEFWEAAAAKDGMPTWLGTVMMVICGMLLAAGLGGYVFGKGF